ncbi:MAG: UbiX family flavin prenyltransferase [Bacteroidales bacterium]|nr:UbiX family flavin prenyltransferase [Bacteroidales bacterium]
MEKQNKHIIISITGASGSIYAKLLLEHLNNLPIKQKPEISVILSETGKKVAEHELGVTFLSSITNKIYNINDFNAPFASGSSVADAMVVVPCSMGTLGRIAHGTSDNLICRAADVILKERKKLILVTRETPLNFIHIKNMETICHADGIILPANPSFYLQPKNIEDVCMTVVHRIVDILDIYHETKRWASE